MSYLIYLRKSRKDSDLESLGIDVLERHERTLLEYAKSRDLPIGDIYREVVSGDSIDARPEMIRLLTEVESGIWDGVLVMEIERLARGDTIDQGRVQRAFFYSSTLIITPSKTYNPSNEFDNEYFEFNLFMSRREYATIKRRMQNGRIRSAKDGYYVGNRPPYGWQRVKAMDGKHYTLIPDPNEEPVLRLMYDFIGNKKYGFHKTASELSKMGIQSRSGKPFNPSTIKGIISNPVNIGKIRWNYRATKKNVINGSIQKSRPKSDEYILVDARHAPLIDLELFRRANASISTSIPPIRNDRLIQNPFAGLLYCANCSRVMIRKKGSNRTPHDYLICQYSGCSTVGIRLDELERVLLAWLQNYIASYELINVSSDISEISTKELIVKNLKKKHSILLQQQYSLFDLLEQGIYTKEIFLERSNSLEKRISGCLKDLALAQKELEQTIDITKKQNCFISRYMNLSDTWDCLNTSDKNAALKELIDKIILTKNKKATRNHRESEFTLDIYPKIPR